MQMAKLAQWFDVQHSTVFEIDAYCLREIPKAAEISSTLSTLHMWQPRDPTESQSDTGSCNRPATLRSATDSNMTTSQLNGNATTQTDSPASPVVNLANYVYQCAAKRESTPSKSSAISKGSSSSSSNRIDLGMSEIKFHEQQMTSWKFQ